MAVMVWLLAMARGVVVGPVGWWLAGWLGGGKGLFSGGYPAGGRLPGLVGGGKRLSGGGFQIGVAFCLAGRWWEAPIRGRLPVGGCWSSSVWLAGSGYLVGFPW
ncbi:hypothetical protein D8M21_08855 [Kocuria sp. HSID16901]|nr:hypothetical protein D8M21_08855 [Kocuria sp. HSID16901]